MDELLTAIAAKRERLDQLRPVAGKALQNLEHYYDIELTYTSNAIEGNTLSAVETTLVIEQGITVGGKPPLCARTGAARNATDRKRCAKSA
jgi:Fic family protein